MTSVPPATRKTRIAIWSAAFGLVAVAVAGVVAYFGFSLYQLHRFPPGYRNRPTQGFHRPGQKEFSQANRQIDSFEGTAAFGNSAAAVELAREFSTTFKAARQKYFTRGIPLEVLESTKGEFLTWCELQTRECAFIVHVPDLRNFEHRVFEKEDARRLLAQAAWASAQAALKSRCQPGMELAVGLRGISQYSPIMLGHCQPEPTGPEDGLVKYIDDTTQSHFLWTFFSHRTK
jgi:hypothetical protein